MAVLELYLVNGDESKFVGDFISEEEVGKYISQYRLPEFPVSAYYRYWQVKDFTYVDYGSHSVFFKYSIEQ